MIAHQIQSRRGVALVIVLAMLVLMSGLMVAFISTATTERSASFANSGTVSARQIADSTVNTVISEIREATSIADEGVTWASQPGAIRTFGGRLQATRKPLRDGAYYQTFTSSPQDYVYKLYSADEMRVPASGGQISPFDEEVEVIESWDSTNPKEEYVDLNRPVLLKLDSTEANKDPTYEPHYPIIDPRAMYKADESENSGTEFGMVEGFDARISKDGKLKLASGASVPYIPMPVKWLYVLRDGSMYTSKKLQENAGVLKNNPVVGRTAFWVDDDTCKLNINTASEGTYWDTPTASGVQEAGLLQDIRGSSAAQIVPGPNTNLNLAAAQPSRNEFQRYPGHPATTSLSPVLGALPPWNLKWDSSSYPLIRSGASYPNSVFKEFIYQIAPFIAHGKNTTIGATVKCDPDLVDLDGTRLIDTKHLFATVDEMLFKSQRFSANNPEIYTPDLKTAITPQALEKTRFFLTANSRAPEVNLFSRPRVTIWPVNAVQDYRTHYDDLFAFASTVYRDNNPANRKDFSILRYDAKSATNDYDGQVIRGNPNNGQNQKMFTYLQKLTGSSNLSVPGFGGSFVGKYGAQERDEILTQIFDYTRAVNLVDTGTASRTGNVFVPYTPRYFPVGFPEANPSDGSYRVMPRSCDWAGQVTPLRVSDSSAQNYQGQGRFFTVSEVAMIFYHSPTAAVPPAPAGDGMRACLVMELATTMPGFVGIRPTFYTRVRRMEERGPLSDVQVKIVSATGEGDFLPVGFSPQRLINICNVSPHEVTEGRAYLPILGNSSQMHYFAEHRGPTDPTNAAFWQIGKSPFDDPNRVNQNPRQAIPKTFINTDQASASYVRGGNTHRIYPYVSNLFPTGASGSFQFRGGKFEIEIWAGEAPDDPRVDDPAAAQTAPIGNKGLVQVVQVDFPETPTGALRFPIKGTSGGDPKLRFTGGLEDRRDWFPSNGIANGAADTVRSMELTTEQTDPNKQGDLRLAAARRVVPPSFFQPRGGMALWSSATPIVHGLTCAHGDPISGYYGSAGRLAPNAPYRTEKPPILPAQTNGVQRADGGPGDWDRGLSKHMSGALSNKVDEGNTGFSYGDGTVAARTPYYRGRSIDETGQTMFSPNRQLSSPVMFGSIPTGVVSGKPWQTLLFRPNRETGGGHPGATGDVPDHLLLDLFNMPVVEPYAISEPLSTAGKVNLNYVIAPFGYAKGEGSSGMGVQTPRSYLRRDTALRGVLKAVCVMAVPTGQSDGGHTETPSNNSVNFRFPVHMNRTIEELETRFKDPQGSLFRSASEICTVDLYPVADGRTQKEASPVTNWNSYWTANGQTGDNMRERPYSLIYPRVTTKSNTYTIHMWCQSIRKSPKSDPGIFDPDKDQVFGDYRGSATIERFVDPNDTELRNYNPETEKIDRYYRYRVVSTKHFSPH